MMTRLAAKTTAGGGPVLWQGSKQCPRSRLSQLLALHGHQ